MGPKKKNFVNGNNGNRMTERRSSRGHGHRGAHEFEDTTSNNAPEEEKERETTRGQDYRGLEHDSSYEAPCGNWQYSRRPEFSNRIRTRRSSRGHGHRGAHEFEDTTSNSSCSNLCAPSSDTAVHRKKLFIVRGNETFSVILEKPKSSSNKRPAEDDDADLEWKAKHVVRLPDCNTSRVLIKCVDLFKKIKKTDKLAESPSRIPSLPAVESTHEKTCVISESAIIPAPSEPASLQEESILKEDDAVSRTQATTSIPFKAQELNFLCTECTKKKVVLKPLKIGKDFTIFLCPTEECVYPLGEDHLYKFLFRNLPNNLLCQCTPSEAPSLDDIVHVISSFGN